MKAHKTGIDFMNIIFENDTSNIAVYPHLYYGSGVGIGDFNKDGLEDIYFGSSQSGGGLYINQGNWKFNEITKTSKIQKVGWQMGINVVDLNNDGFDDIYINVSGKQNTKNKLFINNGDLTFDEKAESYGLAEQRQTIQSSFFDFDMDGDLDVFMIVNPDDYSSIAVNRLRKKQNDGRAKSTDILYRNNGDNTFTDISKQAGIVAEGYSLGLSICDVNADNWPDIYISNDFLSNDVLYINQGDGTFLDMANTFLTHTSFAGMGIDAADINNDSFTDIIQLDMRPEDSYRQKMILPPAAINTYFRAMEQGYQRQQNRNSLQLNNHGKSFSEVGYLSRVSSTDWSWSALLIDLDNDMDKDLYITNGYYRDIGNRDFINYVSDTNPFGTNSKKREQKYLEKVKQLQHVSIPNYVFENKDGIHFKTMNGSWGLEYPSISHGATYADLDNDGDLDIVTNNLNEKPGLIRNNLNNNNYVNVILKGSEQNLNALGAVIKLYVGETCQTIYQSPFRGYLSSVTKKVHFGLNDNIKADSLEVIWPDNKYTIIRDIKKGQNVKVNYSQKHAEKNFKDNLSSKNTYFVQRIDSTINSYPHKEDSFIDFNIQPLMPRMYSRLGPAVAIGDLNGDSLQDIFFGTAKDAENCIFQQQTDGSFKKKTLGGMKTEDTWAYCLDGDMDGDMDVMVLEKNSLEQSKSNQDKLAYYQNDGTGFLLKEYIVLPESIKNIGSIAIGDWDNDGDDDVFVGGGVATDEYPLISQSHFLLNESNGAGKIKYTDITSSIIGPNFKPGIVSDCKFVDIDNDNLLDLILVGEFMEIKIFKNVGQKYVENSSEMGLKNTSGWWNTIELGDFNTDGFIDILVGNNGLNTPYQPTFENPIVLYAKDFDKNGKLDPMLTYYLNDSEELIWTRDDIARQIATFKNRFPNNNNFAEKHFKRVFKEDELANAIKLKAHLMKSVILINNKGKKFEIRDLPIQTQMSPITDFLTDDFNHDGNLDAIAIGNSNMTNVNDGWQDAFRDILILLGDGEGNFKTLTNDTKNTSSFSFPRIAKKINIRGNKHVVIGQNDDKMLLFEYSNIKPLEN